MDAPGPDWRSAPCGLLRIDRQGRLGAVNDRFAALLGYEANKMPGMPLDAILSPAACLLFEVNVMPLLRLGGGVEEVRLTLTSKANTEVPVLLAARADSASEFLEAACLPVPQLDAYHAEIIEARAAAERALTGDAVVRQLREEVERQAADLDRNVRALEATGQDLVQVGRALYHSLREPVRKVSLLTDLLASKLDAPPQETRRMADNIRASTARMSRLLTLLQDYLSLIGPLERVAAVDLRACLVAAAERVRRDHPAAGLSFRCEELPSVEGSRAQLELMFALLLDNSVRYARQGVSPVVVVTGSVVQHNAFRPGGERYRYVDFARLTFEDNSRGLKATPSLFTIFARPDPDHPGMSSGLARCRRVIDNHFGYIRLDEGHREGARFVILLPVRQ